MPRTDRTRWMSTFDSIEDINAWLLGFGVFLQDQKLLDMWGARQRRLNDPDCKYTIDYRFEVGGRSGHKPFVQYFKKFWGKNARQRPEGLEKRFTPGPE